MAGPLGPGQGGPPPGFQGGPPPGFQGGPPPGFQGGPPGGPGGPGGPPKPVPTEGLVARNIDGKVHIFDKETGEEVFDIPAHQKAYHERKVRAKINTCGVYGVCVCVVYVCCVCVCVLYVYVCVVCVCMCCVCFVFVRICDFRM